MIDNRLIITKPVSNYWVEYIKRRVSKKRNKNFLAVCVGDTGSGKSYAVIRIGELIDPDFTIKNVVFNGKELMNLLNTKQVKRGSVVIYDECGVDINARQWWSVMNKMINFLLQTFRHMGIIVLFTVPDFSFVDKSVRKLFHGYFEPMGINYDKKINYVKAQFIENNPKTGKQYFKRLIVSNRMTGETKKVNRLICGLPSKQLRIDYEKKKKDFSFQLNLDIETTLNGAHYKANLKPKKLTPKQERIYQYIKEGHTQKKIAELLGVCGSSVSQGVILIKKKGYLTDNDTYQK